ncbi:rab-GTPase-TBC domain-containing protein [Kockiozyma suomiensis]|uniref:rab-GTPase-TBC domain-containing protein n=1 Tax=Kockiozyma suomiensis TaxID=1337062 RepID=UPI00334383B6
MDERQQQQAYLLLLEKYNAAPEHALLAGGIEDWEGVVPDNVDRYGFVDTKQQQQEQYRYRHRPLRSLLGSKGITRTAPAAVRTRTISPDEEVRRERKRESKWTAMAVRSNSSFTFDIRSLKLRSRTVKGVPDAWRAAAWASFVGLDSRTNNSMSRLYSEYLSRASPADSQVDLDVPRTAGKHVMFSARYGGGQRLLFRVLHAFSLHRADVGYVQGMAALGATLLCYFDESTAFAMLVLLFDKRHMDVLYAHGFGGLVAALDDLSTALEKRRVGKALVKLGIEPMVYATKWYLTLFNYAVPFATQVRIWDLFLLIGDLKVLHAAAIALLDAMGDDLAVDDFESAMTRLSRVVEIKDVDLYMKIVEYEYNTLLQD